MKLIRRSYILTTHWPYCWIVYRMYVHKIRKCKTCYIQYSYFPRQYLLPQQVAISLRSRYLSFFKVGQQSRSVNSSHLAWKNCLWYPINNVGTRLAYIDISRTFIVLMCYKMRYLQWVAPNRMRVIMTGQTCWLHEKSWLSYAIGSYLSWFEYPHGFEVNLVFIVDAQLNPH